MKLKGMTGVLSSVRAVNVWSAIRFFGSSTKRQARFRSNSTGGGGASLKEIGRLIPPKKLTDGPYAPGQLFLHKVFAYRGIVICSFKCKVHEKPRATPKGDVVAKAELVPYYQVLVHRGDWRFMRFPVDITSYLGEAGVRGEKLLTVINGMDCVPHDELIPFTACDTKPIDHDLFDRIFEVVPEISDEKEVQLAIRKELMPNYLASQRSWLSPQEVYRETTDGIQVTVTTFYLGANVIAGQQKHCVQVQLAIRKELMPNYLASQRSWLSPQEVYRETTDGIQVTVTTFYLGANVIAGQQKHCWRYVIRLENLENTTVILRERAMKVFSLNNMQQVSGHGVIGSNPRLSPQEPAFQFSSTVDLPQPKGAHMWGKFKMERENGSCFDVTIPTIVLESHAERMPEQTGTQLQ
ncbi:Polymerase delta-interacting protein 2 [Toxocara canis]|uniref:Polymerase delta-interacting protein 2 n=1 Tax=Toxocara canis TaxID=6265 RepID=A0A0B2VLM8_TOXCA|nr:Polymerase delta-interacting protein 2 [Toxocara canis]